MSSTAIWIGIAAVLAVILPIIFKDSWKNYVLRNVDRSLKVNLNPDVKIIGDQIDLEKFFPPPAPPNTRLDKNVQFTVYRPATILPDKEYTLVAFAHLTKRRADAPEDEPDPVREVHRLATKILSDQTAKYEAAKLDEAFSVPQKGWLLFVPEIEGCTFNPPTQTVQWLNSVQKVEFGMTASTEVDGRDVQGQMTIYLGRTYLTHVPLRITVDSKLVVPEFQQGVLTETSAEPYRKIFASYSRKDTEIVEDFEAYVEALGDEYLRDVKNIRAGEVWSEKLEELIRDASVFQLFWSSNSMRSEFVKQEWEYALGLNREKFIRPVYWEVPRPERKPDLPPPNLDRLEFYKFPVDIEEEHAAAPPVWPKQGGDSVTTHGQGGTQAYAPNPESPLQERESWWLRLRSGHVTQLLSVVVFGTLAAAVFVGYQGLFSLGSPPPECPECPLPTPTETRGIGLSPLPTPFPSNQPTPVGSPSSSPRSSATPTPLPSAKPTPTPKPFAGSTISVRIEPAVLKNRKGIGAYFLTITNEGEDPIERVLIRQTLRKDVKYVSSNPPADLDGEAVALSLGKISHKQPIRVKVTIRILREVKPGETYTPEHTTVTYLDFQGNQHKYSP